MTPVSATEKSTVRPDRRRRTALLVLLLVVTVGALVAVLLVLTRDRDRGPTEYGSTARLSEVQASCRDWMGSSTGASASDDKWCTDMFAWMGDQQGKSMMGTMMWQGPEQLGSSCRAWMSVAADTRAADLQRCDDMVAWMDEHMTSRGGRWMMGG